MTKLVCLFILASCGHGEGDIDGTVGGACASDRDCDSRCYLGADFPNGFCSHSCVTDNDCPTDTYCVTESGGVCMFICPPFDCSRLGPAWSCRDKEHVGGGVVNVCSGD